MLYDMLYIMFDFYQISISCALGDNGLMVGCCHKKSIEIENMELKLHPEVHGLRLIYMRWLKLKIEH